MKKTTMMQLAFASLLLLGACKKDKHEGPMESAGKEADKAGADVSEKADEAAEDTGDAVKDKTN